MYLGAPLMSVILIIIFLIPALWKKIIQPERNKGEIFKVIKEIYWEVLSL